MERGKSIEREFLSHIYIYIYFAVIDIDDPTRRRVFEFYKKKEGIKFFKLFLLIFFLSFDQFIKNDVTTYVNQFLSSKSNVYIICSFINQKVGKM